ncbi:type II toxin-antitoxin system HipA family toxin [Sedimenticola selenatireducens]|uniref:HipA domain-containing protein n=1 Tax=Sedimenticola selenatireducens TaxID=191960 RepID=A0A557SEM9_9GAMM|nr:HipA domain-containing protein [Sedimenticola selenatireducens]TVO75885.1 HipA domain-containing protein [Sedimenticola selenatireducens]TVT63744.1 MAG: HipA domain-containing protein [Sedimenticola selenatireducens]
MLHDFNQAGANAYEQAVQTIQLLALPIEDIEQQIRRTFLNVLARNHDDHVKNIAFLMNKQGEWRPSPAFDVAYSYNPSGAWTSRHQMSLNGKRDNFEIGDLLTFGQTAGFKKAKAMTLLREVAGSVKKTGVHMPKQRGCLREI